MSDKGARRTFQKPRKCENLEKIKKKIKRKIGASEFRYSNWISTNGIFASDESVNAVEMPNDFTAFPSIRFLFLQ